MVDWSLRQCLQAHGIYLNPGLRSYNVPSLKCLRWFETRSAFDMQRVRSGNSVIPLIDGAQTFASMLEALRTANSSGHYIYLLGWWLTDDLQLSEGDSSSTTRAIFTIASRYGVQVRAMLWDQVGTQNSDEVEHINDLMNGAAVLDDRTLDGFGSHHQKILVVKGPEGLIAFCGGIDINPDRVSWGNSGSDGAPLHDVHFRLQGPAAYDLLRIFLERWQDHPDHADLDKNKGPLIGLAEPVPPKIGTKYVQIGRTYGNGPNHDMDPGYNFAPHGETTARQVILRSISEARRFIYMEDQYLVDMEASQALQAALPNIQHLTILIPDGSIGDLPQVCYRRQQFIAPLKAAGGDKVRVFILSPPGAFHTYVHSKTYIIDDYFAITGSANCNRRGWTHDSEVVAGVLDTADGEFARRLRIALWAEHLNLDIADGRLADGVMGAELWMKPPVGARIAKYDENVGIEDVHTDVMWDNFEDPNGL